MGWLVLGVVVVLAAGAAFAVALARRAKTDFAAQNEVIPGLASSVPASWAGAHHVEAKLHRRLVDAMAGLRANQAFDDDGGLLSLRVELEQQAVALDERLVAIAALPDRLREEPRAQATAQVTQIEEAVASLVGVSAREAGPALTAALATIKERSELLGEVRAQLDAIPETQPETQPGTEAGPGTVQPG